MKKNLGIVLVVFGLLAFVMGCSGDPAPSVAPNSEPAKSAEETGKDRHKAGESNRDSKSSESGRG